MAHPNQAKNNKAYRQRLKIRAQQAKERLAELESEVGRLSRLLSESEAARVSLERVLSSTRRDQ
jgi:predicted  nucleic acid-binding Zn-ribbon protein